MYNEPKYIILLDNKCFVRDDDGYIMQFDTEMGAEGYAFAMFYPIYKYEIKYM
jgi:hypothetical protein